MTDQTVGAPSETCGGAAADSAGLAERRQLRLLLEERVERATRDVNGYATDGIRGRLTDDDRDRLNQTYGLTDHDLRYDLREDSRVDINDRDLADRDRSIAERERALSERERELDERERKLSDRGMVQETVVERKPVVVEETIVRRRRLDPDDPEARDLDTSRDV